MSELFEKLSSDRGQSFLVLSWSLSLYFIACYSFPENPLWFNVSVSTASILIAYSVVNAYHQAPLLFNGRPLPITTKAGPHLTFGVPFIGGVLQFFGVFLLWAQGEEVSSRDRIFDGSAFARCGKGQGYLMRLHVTGVIHPENMAKLMLASGDNEDKIEQFIRDISLAKIKPFIMRLVSSMGHDELFKVSSKTFEVKGGQLTDLKGNELGLTLQLRVVQVEEVDQSTQRIFEAYAQNCKSGIVGDLLNNLRRQFPDMKDHDLMSMMSSFSGNENPGFFSFKFRE